MRGRGADGFSVFELLIALALAGLVAVAGAQLIAEAVTITEASGRALRSPALTLAVVALRRDVHDAAGLTHPPPVGWCQNPLELQLWDGGRVRLAEDGGDLVRTSFDALGRPAGRRVLLRGITGWWWRSPNPATVDVRLTALVYPHPLAARRPLAVRRTEIRRFTLRGVPDGRSW